MIDYMFSTRLEAEKFVEKLEELMEKNKQVSVSDANHILGIGDCTSDDPKRGWIGYLFTRIVPTSTGECQVTLPNSVSLDTRTNHLVNTNDEMVNHPSHYQSETGLETIDVIEAFTFDLKGIEATDTGNVLKYMCRWKSKNGLQDLEKAKWYLEHLIKHVKKLEEENK